MKTAKEYILEINKLNTQIDSLTKENRGLKLKLNKMTEKYDKLLVKIIGDDQSQEQSTPPPISIIKDKLALLKERIFNDFAQNEKNKKSNGNRYSQETYEFCHLLNNISNKAYETLRNVFALPCRKSINEHFSKVENALSNYIQNIWKVTNLIKKHKEF